MSLVPVTADDYRSLAERRLPRFLFDFIDGGACDEVTLDMNVRDFRRYLPRQRVMRDVSSVDTSTTLAGVSASMPLALAPVGMAGMFSRRAEAQAKRAADAAGVPFTLSTVSICSLEEIAAISDKPFWFQLYMLRDREVVKELLQRAWSVGVRVLLFTVDLAVVGDRYRDTRNGITGGASRFGRFRAGPLSYLTHPNWLVDVGLRGKPHTFGNVANYVPAANNPAAFRDWVNDQYDASVTWVDIEWLREIWQGKLIIKGVLTSEDALAARRAGADGVVVSNHGGRQLDGAPSAISSVTAVSEAVQGEIEVLMDGGVRSGLDIFRARALGASGVLVGRPWAYAMAARGETGTRELLQVMQRNLSVTMALCGITANSGIDQNAIVRR